MSEVSLKLVPGRPRRAAFLALEGLRTVIEGRVIVLGNLNWNLSGT